MTRSESSWRRLGLDRFGQGAKSDDVRARALPSGVTHWEGPGLEAWEPWTPHEARLTLGDVGVSWCVVGGWAIDLFVGAQTRPHDDLEIAVLREDFDAVREGLRAFEMYSVGDGEVRRLAVGHRPAVDKHQNWVLDPARQRWRADVMLEPGDAATWVFRRDETIQAERSRMIQRTVDGIPYLSPMGTLLFKAKTSRPKDHADFEACLPRLSSDERAWLRHALELVHPRHSWIGQIT